MFLLLVGCAATVNLNVDVDGDGLVDKEEAKAGSNPTLADSDGDSYDDASEVTSHTDPMDPEDRPYQLGWQIDACRNGVEGTGFKKGDVVSPFSLVDQLDEAVRMHDFCDQVVLLDFSAGWCGICQGEAPVLQSFFEEHEEDGFMALTVYMENTDHTPPTIEESKKWGETYELTFPVLLDDGSVYNSFASATGQSTIGLPLMVLIDRGMVVTMSEGASTDDALKLLGK